MSGNRLSILSRAAPAVLLLVAGCAGHRVVTATGSAALDTYMQEGRSRGQAVELARRAATLVAQRNLIERYAGTFLESQTAVENFVTKADHIITRTGGLVKGARVVRVELSPDQTSYHVVVEAPVDDLRESLGDAPEPRSALTAPITWPGELGGGPRPTAEPLDIESNLKTVTAKGTGLPPKDVDDPRVARLRARRAAKTDALRNLAERVKGVRLSSTTTVEDFVARRDLIRTRLDAAIRNARVVEMKEQADGSYEAVVAIDAPEIEAALGLE